MFMQFLRAIVDFIVHSKRPTTALYRGGGSVVAGFVHVDTVRCGTTREIHVDAPGRVTAVARVLTRPGAMPQLHTC